jgi:hypothetical protein
MYTHSAHLETDKYDFACYLFARAPFMLATFRKSLPSLIFHFVSDSRFGGFATTLLYLQPSEKKNKLENWPEQDFGYLVNSPFRIDLMQLQKSRIAYLRVPIVQKESKISAKLVGLHHYREVNKFCRKSESRVPYLKNIKN